MKNIKLFFIMVSLISCGFIFAQTTTNYGVDSGTQGLNNSFYGYKAGEITTEDNNTFLGYYSGAVNTSGNSNVFLGKNSGRLNISGNFNFFGGISAGYKNTTGNDNVFIGYATGFNNNGIRNVFIGFQAGHYNTLASHNMFSGFQAGHYNTTGFSNVFSGSMAGRNNKQGSNNAFFGRNAGYANINANENTFIGSASGRYNTNGTKNVFLGTNSGYNGLGSGNIMLGYSAGYNETSDNKLYIENSDASVPLIYGDFSTDQVGINTKIIPTGFDMALKGKLITQEIKVQTYGSTGWPDFVFNPNYNLPTLLEVEKHINEKGHLKDIPSSLQVKKNGGIQLGEMNAKLLQKIEELTLYTIQQEKRIKNLETLKEENNLLKSRLDKIEKLVLINSVKH